MNEPPTPEPLRDLPPASTVRPLGVVSAVLIWCGCAFGLGGAAWFWTVPAKLPWPDWPVAERDAAWDDNLAFHLARGSGFYLDFNAPEWLQQNPQIWEPSGKRPPPEMQMSGPTTSRVPLLPALKSTLFRLPVDSHSALRLINLILVVVAISTLCTYAAIRLQSVVLPVLATLTLASERSFFQVIELVPTTGVTLFLVTLFVLQISQATRRGRNRRWAWAGMLLGLAMLARDDLLVWFLLSLVVLPMVVVSWSLTGRSLRPLWFGSLAFYLALLAVVGPWWIRNHVQAQAWLPLGNPVFLELSAGYCDAAFQDWGNRSPEATTSVRRYCLRSNQEEGKSLAALEYEMGRLSIQRAAGWMTRHFSQLPRLAGSKLLGHLGLIHHDDWRWRVANGLLILSAGIGCYLMRQPLAFWIAIVVAMSLVTACATSTDSGRSLLILHPLLHVASAITLMRAGQGVLELYRRWRERRNSSAQATGDDRDIDDIGGRAAAR